MPRRPSRRPAVRAPYAAAHRPVALLAALLVLAPTRAWATGPAVPWDGPLDNLLNNLSGPTARALVLIAIVATGLLWAFTRNEEGLKRVGQIAFGGAIAMGAVTLFANLGLTAGALV
jgi:type IV secretion system protein TrbC